MKNTIKLIGIIAITAVIGFSFAACDNGTTGDDTYGCAYSTSEKGESMDGSVSGTHYLLTISFDEAMENITNALGAPSGEAGLLLFTDISKQAVAVILEKHDGGGVGLIELNGTSARGFRWQ